MVQRYEEKLIYVIVFFNYFLKLMIFNISFRQNCIIIRNLINSNDDFRNENQIVNRKKLGGQSSL